ncbi:MAG: hypothetical protein Q9183_002610 [Haloplaca sp. 2 TL-2023]
MAPNVDKDKSGEIPALTGHKRSISGALLSRLSLSSPSRDDEEPNPPKMPSSPVSNGPRSPRATGGAMASAMKQSKTRNRKGSLRKTALLGTGRLRTQQPPKPDVEDRTDKHDKNSNGNSPEPQSPEEIPTPRPFPKTQPPVPYASHPVHGILHKALIEHTPAGQKNRKSPSPNDDEHALTPAAPLTAINLAIPSKSSLSPSTSSTSDSYFPPQHGILPRPRNRYSPKSPLSAVAAEAVLPSPDEEWDYTETRWWGWVVLAVTWIVFVVGMGSCLGVWSWAWDVGDTPYAPPEFEDDDTLPIVGYYPALIILTGIMAWVWVTVAWVGMKYFKHAKMGGEDEV